jgi:tetratricopeptide (TPR) repeat protein
MKYLLTICLIVLLNCFLHAQKLKTLEQEQLLEFYQSQRYAEAAKLLKGIFGEDPQDLQAVSMLAYANNMAGSLKDAEKQYLKLYQADTNNIAVLFSLAGINAKRGNDDKSKALYQQVLRIDSNNFRALKLVANMITADKAEEKLKYLQTANRLNPSDGDVAYDLAVEYKKQAMLAPAYDVLHQAYAADTSNYMLLKARLPICLSLKKLKEAEEIGNKLLNDGDSSSFVINCMAKLNMENKIYEKAISLFKVLEIRDEQSEASLYYTAVCYQKLKDLENAKSYAKAAIKFGISPNISSYYTMLGNLHETSGNYKPALAAYKKGLQFENTGSVYYNLGLLSDFKLKNKMAALSYYKQYLNSKPDAQQHHENIGYVKERIKLLGN